MFFNPVSTKNLIITELSIQLNWVVRQINIFVHHRKKIVQLKKKKKCQISNQHLKNTVF